MRALLEQGRRLHASRIGRNATYNLVGWLVALAANLVVLPYAVRTIGTEQYGIFVLVTSVVGFLGLLELGLGNAVVKYVAEYAASGSWDLVYRAVSSATAILLAIGILSGVALYMLASPLARVLLHGDQGLERVTVTSLKLAALGIVVTTGTSPLSSVPQALQRYGLYNAVIIAFGVLNALGTIAVLALGFGLLGLVAMTVASSLLMAVVYGFLIRTLLPGFRIRVGLDRRHAQQIFTFGGYTLLGRVSYLVNTQVFRIIVGVVLSATAVTYFAVTSRAVLAIAGVFASVTNVLVPAASELHVRADAEQLRSLFRRTERIIALASVGPFTLLALLSRPLLALWMGAEFADAAWVLLMILALAHFLYVLAMVPDNIALGLGHARMVSYASLATTVTMCLSILPLARALGLVGVGISVVLGAAAGLSIRVALLRALAMPPLAAEPGA